MKKIITAATLAVALVALSGCSSISGLLDRIADASRGPALEIVKNVVVLILKDVTDEMKKQHEDAVAEVADLRPREGLVFDTMAHARLKEAEVEKASTVYLSPTQRLYIVLIANEKVLIRVDEAEDSRVRRFAELGTFDLEKAVKVTGLFYAGPEPFRYFLDVQRAHL